MHKSTYLRMEYLVKYYDKVVRSSGKKVKVLDIGSYDVNGSYRNIFDDDRYDYNGLDIEAGPNVDIVPKNIYEWSEIDSNSYDLVISGQAYEHIEFPWLSIKEVERVLRPGGLCMIIAPSTSNEHKYPVDCYRYYPDGMKALAKWAGLHVLHASTGGVPSWNCDKDWTSVDGDTCLVAQKSPLTVKDMEEPFLYEKRIGFGFKESFKYTSLETAVCDMCRDYDATKPYAICGTNITSNKIAEILGQDKVAFFVGRSLAGKQFAGKDVISYKEFSKKNKDDYNCLVIDDFAHTRKHMIMLKLMGKRAVSMYPSMTGKSLLSLICLSK